MTRTAWHWRARVLWVVHPLNSESVSYVDRAHRVDDGALLPADALRGDPRRHRLDAVLDSGTWIAAAVVASALGMASKESMVTAPVMVLIFDRVFLYEPWREAWAERRYALCRPGRDVGRAGG